ncbi:hypothetical protein IGB42_01520 [Andreprevotia sp. IGB-42]|uniref:gamma-butyrobetaine hydroxylase-like domain-containing protein n=1 Tax=Andreprevotia sp. IGB-42 TaxID=2497473 RepID=UPI001356B371|nr:DUF971 domain-containing protein [Andreprevotia sp. IGB-42]KAF0813841.1 hypothetical protein IGB42_01520 [Andreprevotia sp. IGB-42]
MTPDQLVLTGEALVIESAGQRSAISFAVLRQQCRCTECRSASLLGKPHPLAAGVQVTGITPVGNYAVQLHFSDGHERGIYPWPYLLSLCEA